MGQLDVLSPKQRIPEAYVSMPGGANNQPSRAHRSAWYRRETVRRIGLTAVAAASLAASVAAGCGGGQSQDANEPSGNFPVEITSASFPASQHLSDDVKMKIAVRNAGSKTIPQVAVTITKTGQGTQAAAFSATSQQTGLSSSSRPNWIVTKSPVGGDSAYSNTWTGGALGAGKTKVFVWTVSPIKAGDYSLTYRVAAGLNGKAKAVLQGGGVPQGTFAVSVSSKPAQAIVDENGNVVRK
jgi:hypothetical protein